MTLVNMSLVCPTAKHLCILNKSGIMLFSHYEKSFVDIHLVFLMVVHSCAILTQIWLVSVSGMSRVLYCTVQVYFCSALVQTGALFIILIRNSRNGIVLQGNKQITAVTTGI